jgi:hypothetical protein
VTWERMIVLCKMMLYHSVIFRISAATYHNYTILSYCTFFPVILYAMNGAEPFLVIFCWCGSTRTNYNLVISSGPNLELAPSSLLSILFRNLACSYNTEMSRSLAQYNVWWGHLELQHRNRAPLNWYQIMGQKGPIFKV